MSREYAVVRAENEFGSPLFQTEDFDAEAVTERLALSGGMLLLISGEDALRQENAALRQSLVDAQAENDAKETFLSNMSHDIRTPMNAIIGMTALAKKHIDEKARVSDSLNKIETASAHLLTLINEVLDMSRINSGRMTISEEFFSLSDLIHDTLTIVRPQMDEKQHSFQYYAKNIHYEGLYGDALRLRQIYVNIINNAVKYTNANGSISMTISEELDGDRCVLLFVCADNGIGMSPEFLEKIFDPFERANSTTISRIEGTGLGMSIVKKLIEAMGGTIEVQSEVGKGTTVFVRTPLRYEQIEVNTESLASKHLLLIEADQSMQGLFTRYLGEYGVSCSVAGSSSEAIAAITDAEFHGSGFDLVIIGSDIGEGRDLFDLASYLHKSNPALHIVLAGEQDWDQIEYRANMSGIERFIPLPLFRKSLLTELNAVLSENEGEATSSLSQELSGKHILLVEDNFINREIAVEILSSTNADIDTAENGLEAVERFNASEPGFYDLILMDVQMPVMDGYAATAEIRASDRPDAKTVKIFAMTANTFAEDIAKATAIGMDGHIAKPIDITKLMQTLRQIL